MPCSIPDSSFLSLMGSGTFGLVDWGVLTTPPYLTEHNTTPHRLEYLMLNESGRRFSKSEVMARFCTNTCHHLTVALPSMTLAEKLAFAAAWSLVRLSTWRYPPQHHSCTPPLLARSFPPRLPALLPTHPSTRTLGPSATRIQKVRLATSIILLLVSGAVPRT